MNFFCGIRLLRIHHMNTLNFLLCLLPCSPSVCSLHLVIVGLWCDFSSAEVTAFPLFSPYFTSLLPILHFLLVINKGLTVEWVSPCKPWMLSSK